MNKEDADFHVEVSNIHLSHIKKAARILSRKPRIEIEVFSKCLGQD